MKYIKRSIQNILIKWLFRGKILTIYGARQIGKTTLAKEILRHHGNQQDYYNCDLINVRQALQKQDSVALKHLFGGRRLVVIDEAQRIENIGLTLKILHDTFPDLQIIATGSSSFELSNKISEPLTGRALEFILYPFSLNELSAIHHAMDFKSHLDYYLRFGMYPEIVNQNEKDAVVLLDNLAGQYLYKDVLEFEQVKKPDMVMKLLQLLSFQLGCEVSKHELATQLAINRDTVERYLNLLEKAFVIFRLKSFSRNLRKELLKKEKIYFYDLGIRNSLIARYNSLEFREDLGALWENFCILERTKFIQNLTGKRNQYFWKTHDRKEIDYVEESDGKIRGFVFKWRQKKMKKPSLFLDTYKNSNVQLIHRDNFWDLLEE